MAHLPDPIDGLTWRPASPDDAEGLARLHAACFEADRGYLLVASEYRDQLTDPANDARADSIVAIDTGGEILAFGMVYLTGGDRSKHRAFPSGNVHPARRGRGIGTALMTWLDRRATERVTGFGDGLKGIIRHTAEMHQTDRIRLYQRFGHQPIRYWSEMIRDLSKPLPPVPRLRGIQIYGWSDITQEAARLVHNQAFADHWGSEPITNESWERYFDEFFLPEASAVAYDDEVPVSYLTAAMYPHDFEARGRREGWIEGLGTIRSHRGRGIATALILEAFARFHDLEATHATLNVDSENPTGAVGFYEKLGFELDKQSVTYATWLD